MTPAEKLRAQNAQFRKEIVKLTDNAYWAVGYGASNVGLIVGDGGVIIIDTTDTTKAAQEIFAEFRKITPLPVKAIIFTHGHPDHISGASVFAEGQPVEIIARENFINFMRDDNDGPSPVKLNRARTRRQFGAGLKSGAERINIGIGPADAPTEGAGQGFLPPTRRMMGAREEIEFCGIRLTLIAASGETPDHMVVWQERTKLLFCGDNYYHSFPNLYAIRGTRFRDYNTWAASLDLLAGLNAEVLAPGHTMPVFGAEQIRDALTSYRDAIRFVVDKSVEGMDAGLSIDDLVASVKLPERLASKPFLQEFYGSVEYAVRAFYSGQMGWFDGNPSNLKPLTALERARRMARLAGGEQNLVGELRKAVSEGDHPWVMELSDSLILLGVEVAEATAAKQAALRSLAELEINAPTRNYYLVSAKEMEGR
jgi:uncharacterized sulfatase